MKEIFFFFSLSFFFRKVDRFVVHIIEAFIGISTNIAKTKMRFVTRIASFVSNGTSLSPNLSKPIGYRRTLT